MEAALAVGVHRGTVSRWFGTYRRDGATGLDKGKRGRRVGDQLMLTAPNSFSSTAFSKFVKFTMDMLFRPPSRTLGAR